ncbi:MAG: BrnT family toxin [Candidatus Riflebacteria bacterium]|nr:BrnT family toxin [Candidatus Riflebacteria bacterium]
MDFHWNRWNIEHLARHGVLPDEAEAAIRSSRRPFPRRIEEDKWLIWGRGRGERLLQVIFVLNDDDSVFVIHARPLTIREKRQMRRRQR